MEGPHAVIAAVAVAAVVVIVVIAAIARRGARPAARRGKARRRLRPFWRRETPRDLADRWRAAAHGPHADPDTGAGDFQATQMMTYADAVKAGFAEPANRPASRADGGSAQARPRAAEDRPPR